MWDACDKDVTIVRSFHRHVTWHYLPSKPITQAEEQDPVQHTAYFLLQIAATLALPVGEMSEVAGFDTGSKYGTLLLLHLNITQYVHLTTPRLKMRRYRSQLEKPDRNAVRPMQRICSQQTPRQ